MVQVIAERNAMGFPPWTRRGSKGQSPLAGAWGGVPNLNFLPLPSRKGTGG